MLSTLAHITAMYVESGVASPDSLREVEALADRVFELDATSPPGHWLKGFAAYQRADLRTAIRFIESARAIEPNDPDTLVLLGYVYPHVGRNDEARELLERSARLDPLTPLIQCMPGFLARPLSTHPLAPGPPPSRMACAAKQAARPRRSPRPSRARRTTARCPPATRSARLNRACLR